MKVRIEYKDKDLNIIDVEECLLQDFCHTLSQRTLSLLYKIEDLVNGKLEYKQIKHDVFDIAGDINRLPTYLVYDENNNSGMKIKPIEKKFFNFFTFRRDKS